MHGYVALLRCMDALADCTLQVHMLSHLHYTLNPGSEILEKHTLGQVLQIATSGVS